MGTSGQRVRYGSVIRLVGLQVSGNALPYKRTHGQGICLGHLAHLLDERRGCDEQEWIIVSHRSPSLEVVDRYKDGIWFGITVTTGIV